MHRNGTLAAPASIDFEHEGHNEPSQIFSSSQSRVYRDKEQAKQLSNGGVPAMKGSPPPLNPALRLAVMHGVASAVRLHIERGDFLHGRDSNGHTALMIAARRNHHDVCALLLQAGVDPDLVDKNGLTAIDLARQAGAPDAYRELLEFNRIRRQVAAEQKADSLPTENGDIGFHSESSAPVIPLDSSSQAAFTDELTLADWEPLSECEPPADDAELRIRASLIQAAIDRHIPFDTLAISWDEVSAYLPEEPHSEAFSEPLEGGLRALFLRGLREGSVPAQQLDCLLDGEDPQAAANTRRLATQVIQDLGAELDERIEALGVHEDHRVPPAGEANDEEQRMLDDAIEHLVSLLRPRNDPGLLFARKAYELPLLTQEEEVEIAKEMEQAREQAIDVLSGWSDGLGVLLLKCGQVESGQLALKNVQAKKNADIDEHHEAEPESEESEAPSRAGREQGHNGGDEDDAEAEEHQATDELEAFARHAHKLSLLMAMPGASDQKRCEVRTVLEEMSLSGTLLCTIDQQPSRQPEAQEFSHHISRFLKARDCLIQSNLKLVVPLVKRYLGTGADFADLLQEGHIGLIRAVDKFDWRRGFRFSTMATWWIRQQISRAAPEHARLIRLPAHGVEKTWDMKRLLQQYQDEHDKMPSVRWLAMQLGLSEPKTESYLRTMSEPLTLDAMESSPWLPVSDEADPMENASRTESVRRAEELLQYLGSKPGKKMAEKVLRMRHGIGTGYDLTLDEIGRRFGVTRERIRQIENKAIGLIRSRLTASANSEATAADETAKPSSERELLSTARNDDGSIVQATGASRKRSPRKSRKTDLQPSTPTSLTTSSSQLPLTERQLELLYKARAIGIRVMTYLDSGRYETLVMLTRINSEQEGEIAAELIESGFSFRPGYGYHT